MMDAASVMLPTDYGKIKHLLKSSTNGSESSPHSRTKVVISAILTGTRTTMPKATLASTPKEQIKIAKSGDTRTCPSIPRIHCYQFLIQEYPGNILGVPWEYPGNILGVPREYPGNILGGTLGISWEVLCWEYPRDILGVPLEVSREYRVYLPTQESSWDGKVTPQKIKRVSDSDFLTWNAGVSI